MRSTLMYWWRMLVVMKKEGGRRWWHGVKYKADWRVWNTGMEW